MGCNTSDVSQPVDGGVSKCVFLPCGWGGTKLLLLLLGFFFFFHQVDKGLFKCVSSDDMDP